MSYLLVTPEDIERNATIGPPLEAELLTCHKVTGVLYFSQSGLSMSRITGHSSFQFSPSKTSELSCWLLQSRVFLVPGWPSFGTAGPQLNSWSLGGRRVFSLLQGIAGADLAARLSNRD